MATLSGVCGGVVQAPEVLFPQGGFQFLVLEDAQEFGGFAETGSGSGGGPAGGVVHGEMPAGGAAEGKPADHQAVRIDGEASLDILQGFPGIGFAGEPGAVAVTPVGMEDEGPRWGELPAPAGTFRHEGQFAQLLAPAVKPEVQPARRAVRRNGAVRNHQPVRLDRSIDPGEVAQGHGTGPLQPRGLAPGQRPEAFPALRELAAGGGEFVGLVDFPVSNRPLDGFLEDLDVGESVAMGGGEAWLHGLDRRGQGCRALQQLGSQGFGDADAGRGHRTDCVRPVVRGSIGVGCDGMTEQWEEQRDGQQGPSWGVRYGVHEVS
jgi:hypothetical protein